MQDKFTILTINGGSSSIKFAVYGCTVGNYELQLSGKIEKIGPAKANFTWQQAAETINRIDIDTKKTGDAISFLIVVERLISCSPIKSI